MSSSQWSGTNGGLLEEEEKEEEEALAKRVYGGNPFVGMPFPRKTAQQTTRLKPQKNQKMPLATSDDELEAVGERKGLKR